MNIIKNLFSSKPQPASTEDLTARLLAQTDKMLAQNHL